MHTFILKILGDKFMMTGNAIPAILLSVLGKGGQHTMSKLSVSKKIYLGLIIAMMITIFCFSATPADQSSQESYAVGRMVGYIFVPDFKNKSAAEQLAFAKKIDHPVRKTAHMTEYAVLSIFLMLFFLPQGSSYTLQASENTAPENSIKSQNDSEAPENSIKSQNDSENSMRLSAKTSAFRRRHPVLSSALFSEAIAFLYACTDEFHQRFTPGRSCQFTDVLIDSAGALIAILIISLIVRRKYMRHHD